MTGVEWDMSEVLEHAARLEAAAVATEREVTSVVSKGALNIKNQQQAEMARSTHFGRIARTISYDIRTVGAFGGGIVEAEIGPNRHWRAARLANIAYFGGARGGGGTVPDPGDALLAEAPRFEQALADLATRHL